MKYLLKSNRKAPQFASAESSDLRGLRTRHLRREMSRRETYVSDLVEAFPELNGPDTRSLTAQYVGGDQWDEFHTQKRQIDRLKLELIRRGCPLVARAEAQSLNTGAKQAEPSSAENSEKTAQTPESKSTDIVADARNVAASKDKREMDRLLKQAPAESMRNLLTPLTENEANVARLRWEYKWKVAKIARAMGKHRTTIDETIVRAETKIDSHCGSKAKMDPHTKSANATAMHHAEASSMENELIQKIDREKHNK